MGLVGDGDGWVWLERAGFSGFVWVFLGLVGVEIGGLGFLGLVVVEIGGLGFSGFGQGGDRWSGCSFSLERSGFGRGGCFCWRGLGFSGFDRGGDRWSFLYCLVDCDSDWASTRWIRCCSW